MVRFVVLTVLVLAGLPLPRQKQPTGDGSRILRGTVTDQNARPIAHAAVQIENERTLDVRSYISEAHGEFHFAELDPDVDYDVRAQFDGLWSEQKTLSQFDERHHPTMVLVIRLPR
jgi:hypothetical protein